MHLGGVEEMLVRSLDNQRMVLIAGEFWEGLAQHVHATETRPGDRRGLALDHGGIQLHVVRRATRMASY